MKSSNKKGVSSIAAALTLLLLAALGGVITYLVAAGAVGRANHVSSMQALYVTQAGIEYAIKRIYDEQDEIVLPPGIVFGEGSFTVSRSGRTLTITGTVGDAVRVHSVDSPTEADCTIINTSNVGLTNQNQRITQVDFQKICLTTTTVRQMQLSWVTDNGERMSEIKINNEIVYTNPTGALSGTLLDTTDYVMTTGNNNVINWFQFDASMAAKTVTFSLIMGDDSIRTAVFVTSS